MTFSHEKFSFDSILKGLINRGLTTASLIVFLGMAGITISWIWSVNRGVEKLVRTYAVGVIDYALNTNELLVIQRDLNNLHKGIFDAFGTKTFVNLTMDGRQLGQTYDPPSFSLLISENKYEFTSAGNRRIGLETRIDHTNVIWKAVLIMLILQGFVLIAGLVWKASARRSLHKISTQLSEAVAWTDRMAEKLSQDSSPTPLADSEVLEISKLLSSMNLMSQQVVQLQKDLRRAEFGRGQMALATQVAHDIRSPLAALHMMERQMDEVSEDKRQIFRLAIGRVREIADSLLKKKKELDLENRSVVPLLPLIESIIQEKSEEWRKHEGLKLISNVSSQEYDLRAAIQPIEFKRVLSNLLNNAAESMPDRHGSVRIQATKTTHGIEITISDDGKGIPSELLPQLMQKGATFGKENGSGLGLHHAKVSAETWGGRIEIESKLGFGTTVFIHLPSAT